MSEKVNALSCDTSRLLYTWMLAHLDVNGCYYADPVIVKNTVFPWREDIKSSKVGEWLDEMEEMGLIKRYNSTGWYLIYPDFEDKQPKIQRDREGKTDIPPPTQEKLMINSCVTPTQNKIKESKVKESKVKGEYNSHNAFYEFWNEYDKKIDKVKCEKWYIKNIESKSRHEEVIKGIKNWKNSGNWNDKQFQPYPYTFLNNERWKDEPPATKPKTPSNIIDAAKRCRSRNPGCREIDKNKAACIYCRAKLW